MSLFLGLWVRRRQSRNLVHLGTGREKTFRRWEQIMPELQELTEGEKARIYDEVVWKIRILVLVVLILLAGILLLALPAARKWFVEVYSLCCDILRILRQRCPICIAVMGSGCLLRPCRFRPCSLFCIW